MDVSKNEGLQLARGGAALSVAYFHSYVAVRGFPEVAAVPIYALSQWGYLGVDLFFAVSGYVICLVVSKPNFSRSSFFIKRVFRLYPMYLIVMAIVAVLALSGHYRVNSIGHFLYSLTLLPQKGAPAYDLSWTLEREIVFYLLAMIIVPMGGIRTLAVVLAVLAFGGWHFGEPWTFHLVSIRQASFLSGVLVFLAGPNIKRFGFIVPIAIGFAVLALFLSFNFDPLRPVAMMLILAGTVNLRLPWERWPARWLVAAGDASYSIYLLHYIVFYLATVAAKLIFAQFPALRQDWLCEPWRWAAIIVCCIISYFTWKFIESPMIACGNAIASSFSMKRAPIPLPHAGP
jgi:exopolysaccharide production protein ExoZ